MRDDEGGGAATIEPVEYEAMEEGTEATESAPEAGGEPTQPNGDVTQPTQPEESADSAPDAAGRSLTDDEVFQGVAALVYASPEPLSERRIAALLEGVELARVRSAIDRMRAALAASGLPLELREIAGGFAIMTSAAIAPVVQRLFQSQKTERISAAALETLAVIAYRQPVTKAEIEAIRGVQAGPILRTLVDRGLVRVTGRADVPGHPLQYGTTKQFLDQFGLGKIDDLPRDSELAKD